MCVYLCIGYHQVEYLGSGTDGDVHRYLEQATGKHVAIKLLERDVKDARDPDRIWREREVRPPPPPFTALLWTSLSERLCVTRATLNAANALH